MLKKRYSKEELATMMELDAAKADINEIVKIIKEKFGIERSASAFRQTINIQKARTKKASTEVSPSIETPSIEPAKVSDEPKLEVSLKPTKKAKK